MVSRLSRMSCLRSPLAQQSGFRTSSNPTEGDRCDGNHYGGNRHGGNRHGGNRRYVRYNVAR